MKMKKWNYKDISNEMDPNIIKHFPHILVLHVLTHGYYLYYYCTTHASSVVTRFGYRGPTFY
jgi:hypothetical protein